MNRDNHDSYDELGCGFGPFQVMRLIHHQNIPPGRHRLFRSAGVGLFDSHRLLPVVLILAATSWMGLAILVVGRRKLPRLRFVEEKGATPLAH